jgi:hypothetical protein
MLDRNYEVFISAYPGYARTAAIDELRARVPADVHGRGILAFALEAINAPIGESRRLAHERGV